MRQEDSGDDTTLLRALGIDPSGVVAREPMAGGMSGARLERLTLRGGDLTPWPQSALRRNSVPRTAAAGGASLPQGEEVPAPTPLSEALLSQAIDRRLSFRVVKQLEPEAGWLSALSGDTRLREVRLWSRGVLADLPAGIETGVVEWVETDGHGALLVRDECGHLVPDPMRTPPGHLPEVVMWLVDALARLHARFWGHTQLRDAELGLMAPEAALLLAAPEALASRVASGDSDPYLPRMLAGWEAFFRLAAPEDAEILRGVLANPAPVIEAVWRLPWTLVHGDVWGPNLGRLPVVRRAPRSGRRALLLDWALAMAGPATYDPLWLCGTWHELAPVRVLAAYRARLARHLAARGIALAAWEWWALADAGYLRTALTCGEALGWAAIQAPPGTARRRMEARVRWWAARGARGARRLVGDSAAGG